MNCCICKVHIGISVWVVGSETRRAFRETYSRPCLSQEHPNTRVSCYRFQFLLRSLSILRLFSVKVEKFELTLSTSRPPGPSNPFLILGSSATVLIPTAPLHSRPRLQPQLLLTDQYLVPCTPFYLLWSTYQIEIVVYFPLVHL
jgi:hypothetical protein